MILYSRKGQKLEALYKQNLRLNNIGTCSVPETADINDRDVWSEYKHNDQGKQDDIGYVSYVVTTNFFPLNECNLLTNYQGLRMGISQLFCLFFTFSELWAVNVLYHFENDTVILPCDQLFNEQIVWQGPDNYSTYGYWDIINPKLSKSNRLTIIHVNGSHQYDLQIRNFSNEDEGHYKCVRGSFGEEFFTLAIGTYPSNLTIVEEDSQHVVYGYLNRELKLKCTVNHGIPNGKLVWMVHNQTLEEKTTASLVYSFVPKQQDHLQNYTCATKSDKAQYSMERTVQLFIYMPPKVLISLHKTLCIAEGEDLKLHCNYSSNHEVIELKWEKMFEHESPLDERSQYLNIKNINRHHAGKYRCIVTNMAGSASDIVTIQVYYPPTVHVTFEDRGNNRQLNCIAHGVPNHYIFTQWEHRSAHSDLIRYLPDDGSGRLILPNIPGETDRHHDRGLYICHASNNVSLNGSNSFVRGEFFLKAQGKPYFVTSNYNTQYGIKGQVGNLTVDFVSFPEITNFTVIGCPETPEIMKIMPKESKVIVEWRERFHGGFPQSVFIQYRRRDVQYWNTIPVSDPGMHSDYIDGLTPGTEYLIRVYSKNMKGASNFTDMKLIRTESAKDSNNETLLFLVFVAPFLIAIGVMYWQYKMVGVGAVENNVYEMQNNVQQNGVAQNAVAQNLDVPIYSSIDRRANLTIGQTVSYSTTPKRKKNLLEKRQNNGGNEIVASVGEASGTVNSATKKGPDRLSYIEVSFEPKPNEYKFHIHGSENRTNYVDIDFSKNICSYVDSHIESDDESSPQACAMLKYEE
ncbi:unnamed protein product [Mytilus edulis]|uniref:Uncharacterized protein n=1 Tax=Mytilus edulis TaxID=6550 RepID=A0A8S3PXN9_MYTED|nr:unnamed protein product [Mytilus edulis]